MRMSDAKGAAWQTDFTYTKKLSPHVQIFEKFWIWAACVGCICPKVQILW